MSDIPATFYIDKAINYAAAANMHPSDITDAIGEKRELLAGIAELEARLDAIPTVLRNEVEDRVIDERVYLRWEGVKFVLANFDSYWPERETT